MLDINKIRDEAERAKIVAGLAKRGFNVDFADFVKLDEQKRKLQSEIESLRSERNKVSAEVGKIMAMSGGIKSPASATHPLYERGKVLNESISKLESDIEGVEKMVFDFVAALPNVPLDDVQAGGKEANKVIKTFKQQTKFDFKPKDHVELCTSLGLVDYERGARMSGAGAWVYTNMGARLEWALWNYFIDFHTANGYELIMPPHLLNYESGFCAGQFPKFQNDVFCTTIEGGMHDGVVEGDANTKFRFLLPTSETALINMHRGEIIPNDKLPIKYAAFSPCYRKEAGSYRTSERGMIRGYQFNKIEMFAFCKAEQGEELFKEFVTNAEKLVEGLGLHYQTVALAAGDVSASMCKTFDIEVYIPSMNGYKEVSSASIAGDFQARRAMIRTKVDVKNNFVFTLNASGLATSRIIPAIVEQYQTKEGRVVVPEVLRKYLGGVEVI